MVVEQLPVIKQNLQKVKADIDKRVAETANLVCTEESVKEIRKVRSAFSSEFLRYESARKKIKSAVLLPYSEFENVYNDCVKDPFILADNCLKQKITEVENVLKEKKQKDVKMYFNELKVANGIEFIYFDQIGLNITLSVSLKSLKEKCKEFVDKIVSDLKLIKLQDYCDEVLVEYKSSLNVSQAIMSVKNRHIAMEKIKIQQSQVDNSEQVIKKTEEVIVLNPPVEEEQIFTTSFSVSATISQLKALKQFLDNGGYKYVTN